MEIKVTRKTSWTDVLNAARETVWKDALDKEPSDTFKHDMCRSEHSPLRALVFDIEMRGIPSFVSVHLVRHKFGVEHFVSSNRPDRNGGKTDITRYSPVNHRMLINAAELIFISRRRLCGMASPETQQVWAAVVDALRKIEPILAAYCVPNCVYRGYCPESHGCGLTSRSSKYFAEKVKNYRAMGRTE